MPSLSRVAVRLALAWLVLGLAGMTAGELSSSRTAGLIAPTWLHALVVGWLTQLVFGVGWWLLPRPPAVRRAPWAPLAWGVVATLNAGLVLRVLAEPWARAGGGAVPALILPAAAALQLAAAVGFAVIAWRRTART